LNRDCNGDITKQAHAETGNGLLKRNDLVAASMNCGIGDPQNVGSYGLVAMNELRQISDFGVGIVGKRKNLTRDPRHYGEIELGRIEAFLKFDSDNLLRI
jgi:hypothetical protein